MPLRTIAISRYKDGGCATFLAGAELKKNSSLVRLIVGLMAFGAWATGARAALGANSLPVVNRAGEWCFNHLSAAAIDRDARMLLSKMTLREKIKIMAFKGVLDIPGIKRLHIPSLIMSDASVGVRRFGTSIAYPASITLAATWNQQLAYQQGIALGKDCRARGIYVIFGPGVNVLREPQDGRNFEFLGEDPFLTSAIADPVIEGIQSQRVAACVKHYAGNEQETHRKRLNCIISKRALEEIYLPPFRSAVVHAHVWTIMAAFNKVNGVFCTANHWLLTTMLRRHWHFKGIAMSDWDATHSTLGALQAGLDMEMHTPIYYNPHKIIPLLKDGKITMAQFNRHALRILRMMIAMDMIEKTQLDKSIPRLGLKRLALAKKIEAQGAVLLKNAHHFLPLNPRKLKTVVVLGPMATPAVTGGGGSSYVRPIQKPISMLSAIKHAFGAHARVIDIPYIGQSKHWYRQNHFTSHGRPGFTQTLNLITSSHASKVAAFWRHYAHPQPIAEVQWTATFTPRQSGWYLLKFFANTDGRIRINGKLVVDQWRPVPVVPYLTSLYFKAGHPYRFYIRVRKILPQTFVHFGLQPVRYPLIKPQYIHAISHASCVIACVGFGTRLERENLDRSYHLPAMQDQYLTDVSKLNKHMVVVVNAGAGVGMEHWIKNTAAVLYAWYPGENGNRAIAQILTGKIDPSGRLPDTFSKHWRDEPAYGHFPGHDNQVTFAEGIFTGYRWFDHKHIQPLFPFGFGLSYTHFSFSPLTITSRGAGKNRTIAVRVSIANTGHRAGAEVAQLYIRPQNSKVVRCFQTLKGFGRVSLQPGQTREVNMKLDWRDFAYFSTPLNRWVVPHGRYEIAVGSNSRDIKSVGVVRW